MANNLKRITNSLMNFFSGQKSKKFYPFKDFASSWTFFLALIFIALLFIGPFFNVIEIYPGDFQNSQNRLYLLSAIAQSLATILTIGISAVLISVQLVSQMFTPKIISLKLKDFYFWLFIVLYIVTIVWVLSSLIWLKNIKWSGSHTDWSMDTGLLMTGASIFFLVPFIQTTIKNLQPAVFIKKFLVRNDFKAVEESLHSAVEEGFSTIIRESGENIVIHTLARMEIVDQAVKLELAEKTAICYLNVGKRARRKEEDDCLREIFMTLTSLTEACTEKKWRAEADIFNDILTELYDSTMDKD